MKKTDIKISVITVCYNSEKTIEKTIQSILSQTYDNIEYIVIDGNSQDNTCKVIEKYADKINYFISEPDTGMYNAMNKGIKVATGDWVFILNSDDLFYEDISIEVAVKNLTKFKGDILLGDIYLDHEITPEVHNRVRSYKYLNTMQAHYEGLYQQAMFYKKSLFEEYCYFDESYKLAADVDWFYKLYKKLKIKYTSDIYCKFLIGGRSSSEAYKKLCDEERAKMVQKYFKKVHLYFYELFKTFEQNFYHFAHKYFRSLARNKNISNFVRDHFWLTINTLMGWRISLLKN